MPACHFEKGFSWFLFYMSHTENNKAVSDNSAKKAQIHNSKNMAKLPKTRSEVGNEIRVKK